MTNFRLVLSYDGTRYRGWQKQGNTDNTIQAKLEALLSKLLSQEIEVAGSGRTDAGVHARAQVCSFKADTEMSCTELLAKIREFLPEDIGAVSLTEAAPRFHARLNAREKTYIYRIWNSDAPNVFERRYMFSFPAPLNIEAMRCAAEKLCGEHDFLAFCSLKKMKKSSVRTIYNIDIEKIGDEVRLSFTGDGFLYNMVRILTGTLLEVGTGIKSADEMDVILSSLDRSRAGFTAPPHGLTLWEVKY